MSAIGISSGHARYPRTSTCISAHADYRPQDFYFSRTQSQALRAATWESRIRPMHSWSEIALYSAGVFAVLVLAASFA